MGKLIAMAGSMAREGPIIFAKIATSPVCMPMLNRWLSVKPSPFFCVRA